MRKKDKISRRNVIILGIFLAVGLLLLYLYLTDFIETSKLYLTSKDSFLFSIGQYSSNPECINITEVILRYYDDPPRKINEDNLLQVHLSVERVCQFKEARILFSVTESVPEKVSLEDSANLSKISVRGENIFNIELLDGPSKAQELYVEVPINHNFFNVYRFQGKSISFGSISFIYKTNIWQGYYIDESSFYLLEGNPDKNFPISKGKEKDYLFHLNPTSSFQFLFDARSKRWFLIQKILDVFALGMAITVLSLYSVAEWILSKFGKIKKQFISRIR